MKILHIFQRVKEPKALFNLFAMPILFAAFLKFTTFGSDRLSDVFFTIGIWGEIVVFFLAFLQMIAGSDNEKIEKSSASRHKISKEAYQSNHQALRILEDKSKEFNEQITMLIDNVKRMNESLTRINDIFKH